MNPLSQTTGPLVWGQLMLKCVNKCSNKQKVSGVKTPSLFTTCHESYIANMNIINIMNTQMMLCCFKYCFTPFVQYLGNTWPGTRKQIPRKLWQVPFQRKQCQEYMGIMLIRRRILLMERLVLERGWIGFTIVCKLDIDFSVVVVRRQPCGNIRILLNILIPSNKKVLLHSYLSLSY